MSPSEGERREWEAEARTVGAAGTGGRAGWRDGRASVPPAALTAALLLSMVVFFACGGDDAAQPPGGGGADGAATAEPDPNAPGVREVAPGRYEAVLFAFANGFAPTEIRVPAGSEVTFRLTSQDEPHGFYVEATDIRVDVIPGEERRVTHTFEEAREHMFLCDVYCGGGHDAMRGRIIVE